MLVFVIGFIFFLLLLFIYSAMKVSSICSRLEEDEDIDYYD